MYSLLIVLLLASCMTHTSNPDASHTSDARVDSTPGDSGSDGALDAVVTQDGATSVCVTTGDGSMFSQCCPFASACDAGTSCYWTFANDATPQQDTAACMATGSTAVGATCSTATNACVAAAWCAPDAQTPQTGTGTCRALCDPAASSCASGQQCVHMPYCASPGNCPPAPSSEIGFCQ